MTDDSAMMGLKDLAGVSEPLTRLIEMVGSGVSRLYTDLFAQRIARQQAAAAEIAAESEGRRLLVSKEFELEAERMDAVSATPGTAMLIEQQEHASVGDISPLQDYLDGLTTAATARKFNNVLLIAAKAAKELEQQPDSPFEHGDIEHDFAGKFFAAAEHVSSAELQDFWGRVLAREAREPGSISRKTLFVLDFMEAEDAKLFEETLRWVWSGILPNGAFEEEESLNWKVRRLSELGLVDGGGVARAITPDEDGRFRHAHPAFIASGKAMMFPGFGSRAPSASPVSFTGFVLTFAGIEIAKIFGELPYDPRSEDAIRRSFTGADPETPIRVRMRTSRPKGDGGA